MFTKIKELLFGKPAVVESPYKVEAPAPMPEPQPAPVVETVKPTVEAPKEVAPEKKKPAAKKPAVKKPAVKKAATPVITATPKNPRKKK
jgi:hypothetical protein